MIRATIRTAASVLLTAALAHGATLPAHGQASFGIGGGPVFPTGGLADAVDAGWHAGVVAEIGLPLLPVSVHADAMFHHMPGRGGGESFRQVAGTLNGRLDLLPVPLLSAYVLGGIGLYASGFDREESGWGAHTGLNAGVGAQVNLLVLRPFLEARFHRVLSDPGRSFVPITIGIVF